MRPSLNSMDAVSGKPPPQRSVYVAIPIPRNLPLRSLRARLSGNDDHSAAAAVHHLLELAGIEEQFGGRDVGHRRGRHEIDTADCVGAMPSSRAAASTRRSSKYAASGLPAPR